MRLETNQSRPVHANLTLIKINSNLNIVCVLHVSICPSQVAYFFKKSIILIIKTFMYFTTFPFFFPPLYSLESCPWKCISNSYFLLILVSCSLVITPHSLFTCLTTNQVPILYYSFFPLFSFANFHHKCTHGNIQINKKIK